MNPHPMGKESTEDNRKKNIAKIILQDLQRTPTLGRGHR